MSKKRVAAPVKAKQRKAAPVVTVVKPKVGKVGALRVTPLIAGKDVVLTGDWGADPVVFVEPGSTDRRGTVRITAHSNLHDNHGWVLTFRDGSWPTRPFALVLQRSGNNCSHIITNAALAVTDRGNTVGGAEAVYDYIVTD
jgi:hypothetical protein